jgi:PAS domain S-box-containing protein
MCAKAVHDLKSPGKPLADSPFPMWVYDLETLTFLDVNNAAIWSYGYSREEFLRMTVLDIRPAQDIPEFLHLWKHSHESTAAKWWHVGKNGKPFPVSITSWEVTFDGKKAELVLARRASEAE